MTQRRIRKDLKEWKDDPLDCAEIFAVPNDYKKWDVLYYGPEETPYEGGVFKIQVKFPNDYPFKPPDLKFSTPIYHINVSRKGKVCLAEILDEWKPQFSMKEIIGWIDMLITDPMGDQAIADEEMILEFLDDKETYEKKAAEWTQKYAIPEKDRCVFAVVYQQMVCNVILCYLVVLFLVARRIAQSKAMNQNKVKKLIVTT